jgi:hypothetical protein
MNTNFGSLRVQPRNPRHVHGDGDDGTTTRWEKARAMGIDLHLPRPRPHRQTRGIMAGVVIGLSLWAVICLFAVWVWRMYG